MWCVPSFLPSSRKSCSSTPGRSVTFGQVGLGHKNPRNIFFVGRQYPSFWVRSLVSRSEGFFRDCSVTFRAFCDPPSKAHRLCTVVEGCGFVPHQTTQDSTTCSFTEENKTSMSNRIGIFRSILNDTIVALPFSFKIFVFCSRVPRPIFLFRGNPNVLPRSIVCGCCSPKPTAAVISLFLPFVCRSMHLIPSPIPQN